MIVKDTNKKVEGDVVVMTQTVEENYTRAMLLREINVCQQRRANIVSDMERAKGLYEAELKKEEEYNAMLKLLPEATLPSVE
jgi:hypothetical protein